MRLKEYNIIFEENKDIIKKYNYYAIAKKDYIIVDLYIRLEND